MPSLLFHLCAVEQLADAKDLLPASVGLALSEDLEYARLGTALPDLPWYEGLRGGLRLFISDPEVPRFARLFHERAPVAMGLKFAELVANGALVGREAGAAFVCGYFMHFAVDRVFGPVVDRLALRHREAGETASAAARRVEWIQSLFYLRARYGRSMLGEGGLRNRFRFTKHRLPTAGVGRGLYELIRLGAAQTLDAAPEKREVDAWVRGAYMHGALLASPLSSKSKALLTPESERQLWQGDEVDMPKLLEQAMANSRKVLERVDAFIARGLFSRRARERFLTEFPEGGVAACAA